MNSTLKSILAPIASLRLTVILLVMSMLVIFAGTAAQKELPLYEVLNRFFYSWGAWIPFKYLFPLWPKPWAGNGWSRAFPFFGGYTLMVALLVNLLAAHAVRFKISAKRAGILLIHFSLILLLVGEFLSSALKTEDHLTFVEGDKRSWVEENRETELAVIDRSPSDHDSVVAIPASRLREGAVLKNEKLPFEVKVERWIPNARLVGPMEQTAQGVERLATAGAMKSVGIKKMPHITGIEASGIDTPAAFLTFTAGRKNLGTYLAGMTLSRPETIAVNGKTYDLDLRLKRTYLPYSFTLLKFSHDNYQGVNMPRNFASHVRLSDPANGVDRDVVIKMNSPLRYGGRTVYQASFDPTNPKSTTLQVVHNPAWIMPYAACALGAIGLVIHFGTVLVGFLRKRATAGELVGFGATPIARTAVDADRASRRRQARDAVRAGQSTYTIPAKFAGFATILPAALAAIAIVSIVGWAFSASTPAVRQFDLPAFGRLPVMYGGRVMPLDTLARTALKVINGKESVRTEERTVPPIEWLADVLSGKPMADKYRVFLIDNPQIKEMLGLNPENLKNVKDPNERRYTFEEILLTNPESGGKLQEQVDALAAVSDKQYDLYQRQIADLHQRLVLQMQLSQTAPLRRLNDIWSESETGKHFVTLLETAASSDPSQRTTEQAEILMEGNRLKQQVQRLQLLQQNKDARKEDLLFVPPAQEGGEWRGMGTLLMDSRTRSPGSVNLPPELASFFKILGDYREGNAASFNAEVKAYSESLAQQFPTTASKSSFESFFNRFDAFTISIVLYILAFLLVAISWLGWSLPLWRSALTMLVIAFLVHTAGLIMRLDISGRPPVTNLYSSAVFIAWGVVLMAMGLEWVFRNGLGIATSAAVGLVSLLIADGLALVDGDTMKPLQAVLDTNFWLATHVVCITLGYAATFLAGALAIAYIIGGVFTRAFEDQDLRKSLARMNYGILCFAIIFSFVGTILGGIWADQSWGRFWGWDPKENGAVLIVLWNAVILHARWGGIVKERGVMVLAVFGNIVTAWSWFGTNMMGVGLHSYGFMESGIFWLSIAVAAHLAIAVVGMLPKSMWMSFAGKAIFGVSARA